MAVRILPAGKPILFPPVQWLADRGGAPPARRRYPASLLRDRPRYRLADRGGAPRGPPLCVAPVLRHRLGWGGVDVVGCPEWRRPG